MNVRSCSYWLTGQRVVLEEGNWLFFMARIIFTLMVSLTMALRAILPAMGTDTFSGPGQDGFNNNRKERQNATTTRRVSVILHPTQNH